MVFAIHWHESAMELHVFPIPIPPPTSLSTRSLWVFPVHQAWAIVSCIQPGLVICFTLDNMHVSILFSCNIPPSPSPRVQKSVLYICVSFSVLHIGLSLRVLWSARRYGQSILKESSSEYSLEGLMLQLKLQYFGHLMQNWLIWKDPDAGKDWRWEWKDNRGWDSWMVSPTRRTWVWVNSGSWW